MYTVKVEYSVALFTGHRDAGITLNLESIQLCSGLVSLDHVAPMHGS